ncbi:MAG: TonB-dependent receptor plug domain-containing protein [candidate division Zixibacteria bacterium]|nr:TonB-dependent receptor plug domain-containing protein [candidate division Zixibacteria bacterium]
MSVRGDKRSEWTYRLSPYVWRQLFLVIACVFIGLCFVSISNAAPNHTLSGYVRDAESNEELLGASIYAADHKTGTKTNDYGFYSLALPPGDYVIRYSFMGYLPRERTITLDADLRLDVALTPTSVTLDSIVVTAERADQNVTEAEMGSIRLSPAQTREIPVLMGEQDVLKTIQLLPGVQEAGEGNSGFHVRGGGVDQNLILLDEATIYSPSHFLGFFSVFNSDAIKDVKLIKGSASAEYGGRLSSVLDIKMKEGNSKHFQGSAGIGLVSSRVNLEGPIRKDKGAYVVTGRRTYFDLFLNASSDESIRKTSLYFYDLNAKANYHLGPNDRVFLSGYFGKDVLGYKGQFGVDWGNTTATARWNHIFNSRLFLNTSLVYSNYDYAIGITNGDELVNIRSGIRDWNLKADFQRFVDSRNTVNFGGQTVHHTFLPGEIEASESSINALRIKNKYALESAVYASHEWSVSPRLQLDYGLRYSSFALLGPGDRFAFGDDGNAIDTTAYSGGELITHYGQLEPRLTTRYLLNDHSSLKASFTRNAQYLHLLSASTTTTPFDLWHPSTNNIRPGISDQLVAGYFRDFADSKYETSLELYYKWLRNQVDYKNGADIFFNELVESELVFGKGRAYGAEVMLKKTRGRLSGWLSYTLSRSEKKFDAINDGAWFRARQDRIHDLEIVGLYELNDSWTMGVNWVYYTGNAVTFPSGKYIVDNHVANLYTGRNSYRMPSYHRLDIGFTWRGKRSSWNLSLYNAYGRRNAYAIYFETVDNQFPQTQAVRVALFTFFPSATYTFEF